MSQQILYKIIFDTDTNAFTFCEKIGIIKRKNCEIKCVKRIFDEFIVYVQSPYGVEDAKDKAMLLIEGWIP